jgi:hypothetical protein
MGRTRRSGSTAGEALLLQLHIVGPQKGVGPFSPTPRSPEWKREVAESTDLRKEGLHDQSPHYRYLDVCQFGDDVALEP